MRQTRLAEIGEARTVPLSIYPTEEELEAEREEAPPRKRKPRKRQRQKAKKVPSPTVERKAKGPPPEVEAQPMSQFDTVRCQLCGVVLIPRMGKRGPGVYCDCKGFRDE